MNYKIYNDYEILYLIREGNEVAYNIMFTKYEGYIRKIVSSFYHYGSKTEDLVQEGRIILSNCILKYNIYMSVSFFSYFTICLRRFVNKEIKKEYYEDFYQIYDYCDLLSDSNMHLGLDDYLSEEEKEIYEWCFVMDRNLVQYTYKKGISYSEGMKKYKKLLVKVRKIYGL